MIYKQYAIDLKKKKNGSPGCEKSSHNLATSWTWQPGKNWSD